MRKISRIDPFMEKLKEYWKSEVPDWRFGQLMSNFLGFAWEAKNSDIFYIEDDEMSRLLDLFFNMETRSDGLFANEE